MRGEGEIQGQADRNLLMILMLSGVLLFNVPVLVITIWFVLVTCLNT